MNRLWGRESDHYYRLTAELAARGAQQATWRLMAFISFGFAIASTVWAFSPVAAHTLWHLILTLFVGLCCFAMGVQWLRQRWPNRTVSKTCALVGGLCLGMANAVVSDPVVGLLGNAAFVVLTIYVALFHALRNLAVLWLFAGVAEAVLVARLAPYDPTLAATAALSFVFSNVFAAAVCRVLLRLTRTDVPGDHLEPLTGFLTRDGFREQLATLLGARSRQDDRFVVVAVINIDNFSLLSSVRGAVYANQVRISVAHRLHETLRRETLVAYPGDAEFFVADLFTSADPTPLSLRLKHAVSDATVGVTASIGVVTSPLGPLTALPPDDVLAELLAVATSAMYEARASGGNQAHFAINPALAVLTNLPKPEPNTPDGDRCP